MYWTLKIPPKYLWNFLLVLFFLFLCFSFFLLIFVLTNKNTEDKKVLVELEKLSDDFSLFCEAIHSSVVTMTDPSSRFVFFKSFQNLKKQEEKRKEEEKRKRKRRKGGGGKCKKKMKKVLHSQFFILFIPQQSSVNGSSKGLFREDSNCVSKYC